MLTEVPILHKPELDRLTYAEWGSGLTDAQWIYREHEMGRTAWSQNHMRCWKWVHENGEVLSSFETYRMFTSSGKTIYGIASVVTPPRHRKRGHASQMLTQGMKQIESEDPRCQGFFLYSEVGSAIYERVGFKAVESFDYVLTPKRAASTRDAIKLITHDELTNVTWVCDPKDVIHVSADQLHWHFTRERVYREMTHAWRSHYNLYAGARNALGEVIWFINHRLNVLQVLAVKGDLSDELVAVMRDYGAQMGLTEIKLWSTESLSTRSLTSLKAAEAMMRPRPDTIAMIRGMDPKDWLPCSRSTWV